MQDIYKFIVRQVAPCRWSIFPLLLLCSLWGNAQIINDPQTFTSQAQIDAFLAGQTKPPTTALSDITFDATGGINDITGFSTLETINGTLTFQNFGVGDAGDPLLSLTSLISVGNLVVSGNDFVEDGFPPSFQTSNFSLTTVFGDIIVENNSTIQDLSLTALSSVQGSIIVRNNPLLATIGASTSLTVIGNVLEIIGNGVTDMNGLTGLQFVDGNIVIRDNAALTSLFGFETLDTAATFTLDNNELLPDLNNLTSLSKLFSALTITNNASLSDCSQLPCQVTVGGSDFNTVDNANVTVSGNTGNCTDKNAIQNDPAVNTRECVQLALPVELLSFTGSLEGGEVDLAWSTATETDNSHFLVERSVDGLTYAAIGRVEGAGTVGYVTDYQYTDGDFAAGVNYYRLRQVDFDGAETLSNVIAIDAGAVAATLGLYPNPVGAGEVLNVKVGSLPGGQTVSADVFSAGGRLIRQQNWSAGDKLQLPTAGLKPGLYVVRLSSGLRTVTERVVIR